MESIDFIKEKLTHLHSICAYLSIKYEYRDYINTHIINIEPKECFEDDDKYVKEQISIENDFEELFPYENILFITDNELIQIESPIVGSVGGVK